ncbi:MAG: Ig-like domain-containing protein [Cyanobacteriota bacterium]
MLPIILTGCSSDDSSSTVPLPPPPPPAPPAPPPPPAPPAPPATPAPTPVPTGSVISISPSNGATNVRIGTSIVIRFSEPVREAPFQQALSITSVAPQQGTVPSRTVTFNADRTEATITFSSPLSNDSVYRVAISSTVPNLFASGRSLAEDFVATFTTGNAATAEGPISFLATQFAAVTDNGQVFSNPTVIPVGYGIRRTAVAENLPVGTYSDYRSILSFAIPSSIPSNAVVQTAQLTLVQLPSNTAGNIPGFGNTGLGFFFLDPTPHNLPSNNVVFQEVTLGAANNVISSDFFAPASTPSFIALSIKGNVLGGDVSAGPRTADVAPGLQRSLASRFYQIRLQCAREVWNNQATPVFPTVSTSVQVAGLASLNATLSRVGAGGTAVFTGGASTLGNPTTNPATYTVAANNIGTATYTYVLTQTTYTASFFASGSTFSASVPTGITLAISSTLIAVTTNNFVGPPASATGVSATGIFTVTGPSQVVDFVSVNLTASASISVAPVQDGLEISQGSGGVCRAEFDKDPGTSSASPITTARGPRLDVTFTLPR